MPSRSPTASTRCDCPGFASSATPRTPAVSPTDVHALRPGVLAAAVETYQPDVLVADKHPGGAQGELLAALHRLWAAGGRRPGSLGVARCPRRPDAHPPLATIIRTKTDKQEAAATYKRTFGHHLLLAMCAETDEVLAGILRPGNAGANTAIDHVQLLGDSLAQLPAVWRAGHEVGGRRVGG